MIQVLAQAVSNAVPVSTAWALIELAAAIASGLAVGSIRVGGVRLGVAGALFTALVMAQCGVAFPPQALGYFRDFGLVLFVYAIGLQVGPGFFASLRSEGVRLNVLAGAVVLLGAGLTAGISWAAGLPERAVSGLYAGAFTSTPALAAGQVVLRQLLAESPESREAAVAATGLAYAVTYPFGVVGPTLAIVILRRLFRVNVNAERTAMVAAEMAKRPASVVADFEVTSSAQAGVALRDHPALRRKLVVLSRLYRDGVASVPRSETVVQVGDVFRVVGAPGDVERLIEEMGKRSAVDLGQVPGGLKRMDLVVTKPGVLRRTLRDLDLRDRIGVTVAQVTRAGVKLLPTAGLALKFGDQLTVIGPEEGLKQAEAEVGNSREALDRPHLLPVFLGIIAGVALGSVPLVVPGLKAPLRIGLAGGPMLAAIALSQLGSIGSVVWYMPAQAAAMVRDLGLAVFLACVGFQSGGGFVERAAHGGVGFLLAGVAITVLPPLLVGIVARKAFKMNFVTLSGWLAGSMTSTPALIFANDSTGSETPAVAYASVAPLCFLLPVLCANLLAICLGS